VNYFEFYPGDYMRDTSTLSLAEHGAYLLLMATYYGAEKALPPDLDSLYRIARAMSDAERAAVDRVAAEFFPIDASDGHRHHARIDVEIEKARRRIAAARENGARGGRPKGSSKKPDGFGSGKPNGTQSKALHAPHATREQQTEPSGSVSSTVGCAAVEDEGKGEALELIGGEQPTPSFSLLLIGDRIAELYERDVETFERAYPSVNVRRALGEAAAWCYSNRKKRPTAAGALRFLNSWLKREADRAADREARGYQSARSIDGGRRESLAERAERLGREGDAREVGALTVVRGGRA
jgi:uncharacterized protein YdaU (DUF1376 family)